MLLARVDTRRSRDKPGPGGHDPQLTGDEIKRPESRAAGEVRSVANLIAWWMEQELAAKPRARKPRDADPKLKRSTYPINLPLTVPERREFKNRAKAERPSVSSWLARGVSSGMQKIDVREAGTAERFPVS